jgi:hypothetical protein
MVTKTEKLEVIRTQTGVRIEQRLLKVMKGLAEYHDLSLGDFIEGVMLHALEGKLPFSDETLLQAKRLNQVYGMTMTAADAHSLIEKRQASRK